MKSCLRTFNTFMRQVPSPFMMKRFWMRVYRTCQDRCHHRTLQTIQTGKKIQTTVRRLLITQTDLEVQRNWKTSRNLSVMSKTIAEYSNCGGDDAKERTSLRPVVCSLTGLINICANRIGEKDNEISLPQDRQIYPTDPEWLGQVLSSPSHQWEWIHPQLTSKVSPCGYAEQSKNHPKKVVRLRCEFAVYRLMIGRRGRFDLTLF